MLSLSKGFASNHQGIQMSKDKDSNGELWTFKYDIDTHKSRLRTGATRKLGSVVNNALKRARVTYSEMVPMENGHDAIRVAFPGANIGDTTAMFIAKSLLGLARETGFNILRVVQKRKTLKGRSSLVIMLTDDKDSDRILPSRSRLLELPVLASSAKRDPRKYRWLQYDGRKAKFHVVGDDKQEYDLELSKGEKIGVKRFRGHIYLVDASDLSLQLKLKPQDAERVIGNSIAYEGKVGRYRVLPYDGGKDKASLKQQRTDSKGRKHLIADSSMFNELVYDPKKKRLYVRFKNGAIWEYADVTAKEARSLERASSQGKWFNRKIKGLKPEVRIDTIPK